MLWNPYAYTGAMYPGAGYPGSPYGGIFDTGADGDPDDPVDEQIAEQIAEQMSEVAVTDDGTGNTSGFALALPSPGEILGQVGALLGFGAPPAKVQKVARKVQAKVATKAPIKLAAKRANPPRPALLPGLHIPPPARPVAQPIMGPVAGRAPAPITSMQELMQRVKWAQLASLTGAPLTVGIGATVATTIPVTRTGWVLDWVTNTGSTGGVISALTYAQQPNTVFNATPLESWSPLAANPTPIDPIYVTMPAAFNVTLTNPTAAAIIVTLTMSGIPAEHVDQALMDPEVAKFLANRGMQIARATQGGYGSF